MTDDILFMRGVNTREEPEQPTYADALFEQMNKKICI
jgi:hypothetical protein